MWDEYVQQLIEYQQKYGHCCVPKHDDNYKELYDWIQHVRSSYARLQRGEVPSIELDDELITNLQSMGLRLSRRESRWKRRLKELLQYRNINGHFQVPHNSKDYPRLANFLRKLQNEYIRREQGEDISILADLHLNKLEKLGYDFQAEKMSPRKDSSPLQSNSNNRQDDLLWQQRVQELSDFKQKHGHFNVPRDVEAYKSLRYWMNNNRYSYLIIKSGKESSRLTKDRLSQLEAIGFTFSEAQLRRRSHVGTSKGNSSDRWDQRIQELKEFEETHGHFDVPQNNEKYKQLAIWMVNNRNSYLRIKSGKECSRLTKDRLSQLEAIGFTFSETRRRIHTGNVKGNVSDRWDQRIQELKEFEETHGHFDVPQNNEKYKQLSSWMRNNRSHYNKIRKGEKSSRLTSERLVQLMDLGVRFENSPRRQSSPSKSKFDDRWNLRVKELETFKIEHGHFRIPENVDKYKQLSNWVINNQNEYNKAKNGLKSRLTDQKIAQLESIGFVNTSREQSPHRQSSTSSNPKARWDLRMKELEAFKETYGHFRIPQDNEKYKRLFHWVANNQSEYNRAKNGLKSRLTDQRIAQLESIGFVNTSQEQWNLRKKELMEAFKNAHGKTAGATSKPDSTIDVDTPGTDTSQSESLPEAASFDEVRNGTSKLNQDSHEHIMEAITNTNHPSTAATLPFLEGLEETVGIVTLEMHRMEQELKNETSSPNGRIRKPNCFWLDIGHSDGINI